MAHRRERRRAVLIGDELAVRVAEPKDDLAREQAAEVVAIHKPGGVAEHLAALGARIGGEDRLEEPFELGRRFVHLHALKVSCQLEHYRWRLDIRRHQHLDGTRVARYTARQVVADLERTAPGVRSAASLPRTLWDPQSQGVFL